MKNSLKTLVILSCLPAFSVKGNMLIQDNSMADSSTGGSASLLTEIESDYCFPFLPTEPKTTLAKKSLPYKDLVRFIATSESPAKSKIVELKTNDEDYVNFDIETTELDQQYANHKQSYDVEVGRNIAALAYHPELAEYQPGLKLTNVKSFKAKTGMIFHSQRDSGVVAEREGTFIVAIRGTQFWNPFDWGTNLDMRSVRADDLGIYGRVHNGFYQYAQSAFKSIWPDLLERINVRYAEAVRAKESNGTRLSEADRSALHMDILKKADFLVHGHSLGGAAAQLVALMIKAQMDKEIEAISSKVVQVAFAPNQVKVFSYESPKPFYSHAAQEFDQLIGKENHVRVIQKDFSAYMHTDPVTALSFKGLGFKHTGTLLVQELETQDQRSAAGPFLHKTTPLMNPLKGFQKGVAHVSQLKNKAKSWFSGALESVRNTVGSMFSTQKTKN